MKRALAYRCGSRLLVHPLSRTIEGVWILGEPCLSADESIDNERLGAMVRDALAGSRSGLPHPSDWTSLLSPLLVQAKVRSWNIFFESATCTEVEEDRGRTRVVPTKKHGGDGGFEAVLTRAVVVDGAATADVGAAVRSALTDPSSSATAD